MDTVLEKPSLQDQKVARESLSAFSSAMAMSKSDLISIRISEDGEMIKIPAIALELLSLILSNMAEGKSVSLIPSESLLTTQEAATLLNVSRPHLVKLLESGVIPFQKVGTHRRVFLEDVNAYEIQLKEKRKNNLQFLADQAQDLNLGYK